MMEQKSIVFEDPSIEGNVFNAMWRGYFIKGIRKLSSHPEYVFVATILPTGFFIKKEELNCNHLPCLNDEEQEYISLKMKNSGIRKINE